MDTLLHSVLPFVGILLVLVVVHELGHFITAKMAGVQVLEFGFGYPPRIWGRKFGETEYTVNLIPLGGFVRLLGEEDPTAPHSLASRPAWVRIIVLASGAMMNVLLPVLLFTATFMIPRDVPVGRAIVTKVESGSPAERAGVQANDLLVSINGREVESTNDASYFVRLYTGSEMTWVVRRTKTGESVVNSRETEDLTLHVYGRWAPPVGQGATGISLFPRVQVPPRRADETARDYVSRLPFRQPDESEAEYAARVPPTLPGEMAADYVKRLPPQRPGETAEEYARRAPPPIPAETEEDYGRRVSQAVRNQPMDRRSYPLWEAAPRAVRSTAEALVLARNQVISWFKQRAAPQVSGPIGIAQVTGEVVEQAGWVALFDLAALLSINLAVFNLLPLPMLDGGRIFFVVVEVLRGGKRVPPEKEALVHLAGFVALIALAVLVSYVDILRIVNGDSPFR